MFGNVLNILGNVQKRLGNVGILYIMYVYGRKFTVISKYSDNNESGEKINRN